MPAITFETWQGGLDRRRPRNVAGGATFFELKNAYITTGYKVRKRPAWRYATTLTIPAAVGLFGAQGELHAFASGSSGVDTVTGDDGRTYTLNIHNTPHASGQPLADVLDVKEFAGALYVITRDTAGNVEHHYIDGTNPPRITDSNAPTTAHQVVVAESKIWGVKGENVRFCATDSARDWTTAGNAGFLPTARSSEGGDPVAVGLYQGLLAVFAVESVQLWAIDPDPAKHALQDVIENTGTQYPHTLVPIAGDLYFVDSVAQVRSLSRLQLVDDVSDVDIGSPIAPLTSADLATPQVQRITSHWIQQLGQMWIMNDEVSSQAPAGTGAGFAFSFSRTTKLSAWNQFAFQPGDYRWFAALGTQFFSLGLNGRVYRMAFKQAHFSDHSFTAVGEDWGLITDTVSETVDHGTIV